MKLGTYTTVSKTSVQDIINTFETTGHETFRTVHEDRVSYILANETGWVLGIEDYHEGENADVCWFEKN